jgi:hypothetical protein
MSDRVIAAWLLALILAAGAVSAQAAEPATKAEPDPAAQIPEDVALFITAQNIPHLFAGVSQGLLAAGTEETRAAGNFLKDLAQIIAGRAAMAIVFEGNDPQFFLRARVDETKRKVRDVVAAQFDVILGKGNYKLVSKGPLHEIQMADGDSIFWWTVRDGVVTLSEIRGHVDRVITPPPKPVRTLAEVDGYKRLAKHVDWHAGLAVYADIHRFPGQGTGRRRPVGVYRPGGFVEPWLRLADFRYAGLSLASEGQTSSGRIAVLAPKQRVGLAKVLDVPNEPLRHAGRIPEDAHLLVARASGGDERSIRSARMAGTSSTRARRGRAACRSRTSRPSTRWTACRAPRSAGNLPRQHANPWPLKPPGSWRRGEGPPLLVLLSGTSEVL